MFPVNSRQASRIKDFALNSNQPLHDEILIGPEPSRHENQKYRQRREENEGQTRLANVSLESWQAASEEVSQGAED